MTGKNLTQFLRAVLWTFSFIYAQTALPATNCADLTQTDLQNPLSLIELTDIALRCNPATAAAWAQVKTNYANVGIAKSTYWPQISGTVNWSEQNSSSDSTTASSVSSRSNTNHTQGINYGPNISLNFLLWDFGTRAAKVSAANLQYQAAELILSETIQQVILQVEQAYYQALGQQALVLANQESLKETQANLDATLAMHKQGLAVKGDVYQAQSALTQAALNLVQAQGASQIARGQLLSTLGIPLTTAMHLSNLPETISTQATLRSLTNALNYAKQHRPDLLAAEAQTKAAIAQLAATERQALPSLQMSASTGKNYPLANTSGGSVSSVSFTLNIPLFSGFAQHYAEQQAKAQIMAAKAQQESLVQQIALQVWQAYFNVQTAVQALTNSDALLKSSIQASKQAHGQYKAGVGNILTVLTTQATAANARAQLIQAKLNWYTSLATLATALGKLDLPPLVESKVSHEIVAQETST